MEGRQAPLRQVLARHVQRSPDRLAPSHRDHRCPRGERVQPLGRRREPGTDDADALRVPVRLVGVDATGIVLQLFGHGEGRVPRRQQDVAERAVAVELEPVGDRRHRGRSGPARRARPSRSLPAAPRRGRGTRRHGRVVSVADAVDERAERAASACLADGEAGERGRKTVAVALGAHVGLPDRLGPAPPDGRRVGLGREDGDLLGLDAAAKQRQEGRRSRPAHRRRSRPGPSPSSLHRPREQALDEVALEGEEDEQRDDERDERGRAR